MVEHVTWSRKQVFALHPVYKRWNIALLDSLHRSLCPPLMITQNILLDILQYLVKIKILRQETGGGRGGSRFQDSFDRADFYSSRFITSQHIKHISLSMHIHIQPGN